MCAQSPAAIELRSALPSETQATRVEYIDHLKEPPAAAIEVEDVKTHLRHGCLQLRCGGPAKRCARE